MPLKCELCGQCHTRRRGCPDPYAMLERMAGPEPEPLNERGAWVLECGKHRRPLRACCEGTYTAKWRWKEEVLPEEAISPPPDPAARLQVYEAALRRIASWRGFMDPVVREVGLKTASDIAAEALAWKTQ